MKGLLVIALAAAAVLGASVWLGASAWASRTAESASAGADVHVRTSDAEPREPVKPRDPAPGEVEVIATVVNESDNPPEEPEPQEPAEPAPPLIVFSQEALDERLEKIVGAIITDGMTRREQAYAIFLYVNSHVRYVGTAPKDSWQEGAFAGLTTGRGDCYTYYALSRALLTAVGIDNLEVRRVGGTDDHYWNLVNCGDGWYHFDAGPHSVPMPEGSSFFLFTDAQAAAYTELAGRNYYDFDGSLYPERAGGEEADVPEETGETGEEPESAGEPQLPGEDPTEDPAEAGEAAPPASPEETGGADAPDDDADAPDGTDESGPDGQEEAAEDPGEADVPDEADEPGEPDELPGEAEAPDEADDAGI